MKVSDFMTRGVISIPVDTPALAVARLLSERHFSAVPVTDSWSMLLGIVSEADLIRRLASSDPPPGGLLHSLFYDRDKAAEQYARVHGATAGDIMTREVVSVTESTTIEHAAQLIETHKVRRLPVLQDGVLVGIISRADMLRALITPTGGVSDEDIRKFVGAEIARLPWADAPFVFFDVANHEVTLYGFCHSEAVKHGLHAIAAAAPGVTAVHDRITDATTMRWV